MSGSLESKMVNILISWTPIPSFIRMIWWLGPRVKFSIALRRSPVNKVTIHTAPDIQGSQSDQRKQFSAELILYLPPSLLWLRLRPAPRLICIARTWFNAVFNFVWCQVESSQSSQCSALAWLKIHSPICIFSSILNSMKQITQVPSDVKS